MPKLVRKLKIVVIFGLGAGCLLLLQLVGHKPLSGLEKGFRIGRKVIAPRVGSRAVREAARAIYLLLKQAGVHEAPLATIEQRFAAHAEITLEMLGAEQL